MTFEHVAGRRLVFERFFEVAGARLQFAEQPRVLDRDDRLVGKGAHQFDLPLSERLDAQAAHRDHADHRSLTQQRHPKHGAYSGCHVLGHRVVRVGGDVRDMHNAASECRSHGYGGPATGDECSLAHPRPIRRVHCAERT
jgi:hypothetical protein